MVPNAKRNEPPRATGVKRLAFVAAGLGCVGLAYLGAILPGLPTTPWVLAASYFFARSSPRLERWLKRSPVFGRFLRDWEEHRGIRRGVKVFAVCMIVTVADADGGNAKTIIRDESGKVMELDWR
jgi:uncharacterized protein